MQYLVSVIFDNAGLATPDEEAAIDVFNDRLQAEGSWVFAGGLAAPSSATVIDNRGGEAMFTDGPFVESKEYLAGFWIIEAAGEDPVALGHQPVVEHVDRSLLVRGGQASVVKDHGNQVPHLGSSPVGRAPFVGGLSPLLRTPLPRSDTASRISFEDFLARRL